MHQLNFSSLELFFNWLDVTISGRKWYLKHRLGSFNFFTIGVDVSISNIPKKLSPLISESLHAQKQFISFEKGL